MGTSSADLTWTREQDRILFDELVTEVINGRCCAFVGAGPSKPAGYPDWAGLLRQMAEEAHLTSEAFRAMNYLDQAEQCYTAMGAEKYNAFLEKMFSADGKEPFRSIHQYLIRIPFKSYLTTNFDGCLEKAAEMIGAQGCIHIFPDLNPGDLLQGHIFHIHGKVQPVGTVILKRSDFHLAYEDSNSIRALLYTVFSYSTVLFVGYSLSDPDLLQILQAVDRERGVMAGEMKRRGVGAMRSNRHYALMPFRLRTVGDGTHENLAPDQEGERAEEQLFEKAGVSVLRYRPDGSDHPGLTQVIEALMQRTQQSPLVPLPTKWDLVLPPGASAL